MTGSATYHASHVRIFPIGGTLCLALDRASNNVVELDAVAARVLGACHGARSLEAHASNALDGASSSVAQVTAALQQLILLGLLRETADGEVATARAGAATSPITTISIVSADRPAKAAQCLAALGRQCDLEDAHPRQMLVDGSRRHQAETAAVVAAASRKARMGVDYIGPQQVDTLVRALSEKGIPRSVLRFALSSGDVGSNRNIALLLTAGENILMADDDVICAPWAWTGARNDLRVGGHEDPHRWEFYATRHDALHATNPIDVNLFQVHAGFLGASFRHLTTRAGLPALDGACAHLISAITGGGELVVRVTLVGVAGDSGRYCPRRLLLLQGRVRDLLRSDHAALAAALTSREVCRAVLQTTVTHDPACQTHFFGLSNLSLLPPFIPRGRNEDGLFGAMLTFMRPHTLYAHLPHGVVHDSDRLPAYGPGETMPSAQQVRLSECLIALLPLVSLAAFGEDPADRLRRIGQTLGELGEMKRREFAMLIKETTLLSRSHEVTGMMRPLLGDLSYSAQWRSAVDEYVRALRANVDGVGFFVPIEFRWGRSIEQDLDETQHFIREFGDLLKWWPEIWHAARHMNQNGD
jgi:hypothetical protein